MKKSPTISKSKPESKALDYAALYREGIEWVQQFAGTVWTDYNLHDPGATLLEYLCYGLTDVGYRCSFPVTDLLYARKGQSIQWADNAFFSIDAILPCAPITKNDYRRLMLDNLVRDIDNVWVTSAKNNKEGFKGLYDIFIQITPDALGDDNDKQKRKEKVEEAVRRLFNIHRNLSEDLNQIHILEHEALDIDATIFIQGDASAEQVLADIAYRTEVFLAPKPQLYDFEALKEAGMSVDEILEGPKPTYGFARLEELELLRFAPSFRVSQLKDKISAVPGIEHLSRFGVRIKSVPQQEDEIVLPLNTYWVLGTGIFESDSTVRLFRNGREVKVNKAEARQLFLARRAQKLQQFRHQIDLRKSTPLSEKNLTDVAAYFSIQRFFPALYGIGSYGLPREAGSLRQAQAKQLKGYLAIFEMMLAGYLKQLTQVRDLFSTGKEVEYVRPDMVQTGRQAVAASEIRPEPTYFAQFPFDIPDVTPLLDFPEAKTGETPYEAANEYLAGLAACGAQDLKRRNAFLDHLLARFAETFDADLLAGFVESSDDERGFQQHLLEAKARILREYDTISRNRSLGFNYAQPEHIVINETTGGSNWSTSNVSVLKKNICYRLNLPFFKDQGLTDYFPFEGFGTGPQLRNETPEKAAISLKGLMREGGKRSNYEIREEDTGCTVCFRENRGNVQPLFHTGNRKDAEDQLAQFMKQLKGFQDNCNGFFIVEHLLLRPLYTKGAKLVLTIQLPSQKEAVVLEGRDYLDTETLDFLARDILLRVSNADNFKVINLDDRSDIVLEVDGKEIMRSKERYNSADAAKIVQELADKIKKMLSDSELFKANDLISYEEEVISGLKIPHEFYAHRISVVAPNWATIFKDQDARQHFQDLVRQLAPAHLFIDFHWFNWHKMKAFESDYKQWMLEKSSPTPLSKRVDGYAVKLIEHLLKL